MGHALSGCFLLVNSDLLVTFLYYGGDGILSLLRSQTQKEPRNLDVQYTAHLL